MHGPESRCGGPSARDRPRARRCTGRRGGRSGRAARRARAAAAPRARRRDERLRARHGGRRRGVRRVRRRRARRREGRRVEAREPARDRRHGDQGDGRERGVRALGSQGDAHGLDAPQILHLRTGAPGGARPRRAKRRGCSTWSTPSSRSSRSTAARRPTRSPPTGATSPTSPRTSTTPGSIRIACAGGSRAVRARARGERARAGDRPAPARGGARSFLAAASARAPGSAPVRDVPLPPRPRTLPRVLAVGDVAPGLLGMPDARPRGLRDQSLELLYGAGLRVSEATGLDVTDLDPDAGLVRCRGKGGRERIVPCGPRAVAAYERYLARGRPALRDRRRGAGAPARRARAAARAPGRVPRRPHVRRGRRDAGVGRPARAPPRVRDAPPARGRRRPRRRAGDARPRLRRDDGDLHARRRGAPRRDVRVAHPRARRRGA